VRIIAGTLKGRRLAAPTWPGLRPTSDKLRETLFNILRTRVEGARVLDGFAGSGAIGIEAISRGAREVTFVESDRRAAALIEENLRRCGVTNGYAIIRAEFASAARSQLAGVVFDLIVLDPPYGEAPAAVLDAAAGILEPDGLVILEHAARQPAPDRVIERQGAGAPGSGLLRRRSVVSGDSALAFYTRDAAGPGT
jgi:16S rRNA (guanine(966)-N(2))-methyltransferase RsmD